MHILIVSTSQRKDSKSLELSHYIQKNVLNKIEELKSSVLDLASFPVLLDHYGYGRDSEEELNQQKSAVLQHMYDCDAVIFVTPEWGGMIPPALVNLLLLSACGSAGGLPFANKPAFAVGVSASGGGSHPISLLKGYTAKNSHLVWLPLHAVVTNVENFLQARWQPENDDRVSQIQSRLEVGIQSLAIYAKQLKPVRSELNELCLQHPYGQ